MDTLDFEKQMKKILHKASIASDMSLERQVVSVDPDCVADFGCDHEGNLVIYGYSFPLKIKDLTGIRYRWNKTDNSNCFYRFDFGEHIFFDCIFNDYDNYNIKYFDTYETYLDREEVIEVIKNCIKESND